MLNRFKQTTFFKFFLILTTTKNTLSILWIVFVTNWTNSLGNCTDNLAEIRSQVIMRRLIQKTHQFMNQQTLVFRHTREQ